MDNAYAEYINMGTQLMLSSIRQVLALRNCRT